MSDKKSMLIGNYNHYVDKNRLYLPGEVGRTIIEINKDYFLNKLTKTSLEYGILKRIGNPEKIENRLYMSLKQKHGFRFIRLDTFGNIDMIENLILRTLNKERWLELHSRNKPNYRIPLPKDIIDDLSLKEGFTLICCIDYMEIWNTNQHKDYLKNQLQQFPKYLIPIK